MLANVSSKRSKSVLIIGLFGLAAIAAALFLIKKNRFLMRPVLFLSKYRRLTPYVIAQAKAETGNFTSRFYREFNNMFGMKGAVKRKQLGRQGTVHESDGGTPIHIYANDIQSLRDLFIYFDYVSFPTAVESVESYVRQLKRRGYFSTTEDHYLALMKSYLKNNQA